jgi:2-haloacid dehalogenase
MKVLAFDVFGTVVDWYSSIVKEVERLRLEVDPGQFALDWRAGYQPAMARVRSGALGWTRIDDLHRMILDDLLARYRISLDEAARQDLNLIWHRLTPWPDSVGGLTRLKSQFTITTLSNGNISLLTNMAKRAGLPWDCILSAENFRHYKPDPQTYLGVCSLFDIPPQEMMLVAAHKDDLDAARVLGCKTAFVERPLEFGPGGNIDLRREPRFDFQARDFQDLADQLSC